MSRAHAFGARLEASTAKATGATRVNRERGERAPDLEPLVLPDGERIVFECKARKRIPHVIEKALVQAQGYDPTATPAVVIRARGERPLLVIGLQAFARIAGIQPREISAQQTFTQPCALCTVLREVA